MDSFDVVDYDMGNSLPVPTPSNIKLNVCLFVFVFVASDTYRWQQERVTIGVANILTHSEGKE